MDSNDPAFESLMPGINLSSRTLAMQALKSFEPICIESNGYTLRFNVVDETMPVCEAVLELIEDPEEIWKRDRHEEVLESGTSFLSMATLSKGGATYGVVAANYDLQYKIDDFLVPEGVLQQAMEATDTDDPTIIEVVEFTRILFLGEVPDEDVESFLEMGDSAETKRMQRILKSGAVDSDDDNRDMLQMIVEEAGCATYKDLWVILMAWHAERERSS